MYLTYTEYQAMGGSLDETAFSEYEFEVEQTIDWHTFNRLKKDSEYPEEVKRCVFKLINIEIKKQQALTLGQDINGNTTASIASQSNDGVSISFNTMNASQAFEKCENDIISTINRYLYGVKNSAGLSLLYRGLYPSE